MTRIPSYRHEFSDGVANADGASTGVARVIAGAYKVVCDSLDVCGAPSLIGVNCCKTFYGDRICSIAAGTIEAGGCVWAHCTACSGATSMWS